MEDAVYVEFPNTSGLYSHFDSSIDPQTFMEEIDGFLRMRGP